MLRAAASCDAVPLLGGGGGVPLQLEEAADDDEAGLTRLVLRGGRWLRW